jgi:hypothetical protein
MPHVTKKARWDSSCGCCRDFDLHPWPSEGSDAARQVDESHAAGRPAVPQIDAATRAAQRRRTQIPHRFCWINSQLGYAIGLGASMRFSDRLWPTTATREVDQP